MRALVREARPGDKEPVLEFVKGIWGGHDYIPAVWDAWLRSKRGKVFVVEADGKPVAMNRVRFLEDGAAWLEGVRVHPGYRRRGLATLLGRNSMSLARRKGARVVRLTSGSANKPAHLQVERMGLKQVARMTIYSFGRRSKVRPARGVRKAKPSETRSILDAVKRSKEYEAGAGVYWDGFTATAINGRTLAALVAEGSVYLAGEAMAVVRRGGEGTPAWRQVCFATGPAGDVARIIGKVYGRKGRGKASWDIVYAPSRSPLVRALTASGLRRWESFILFEGRVPKS